jgi:hypothetical protein
MSKPGETGKRVKRPVDDLPVLTEEVDALQAAGRGSEAQIDAIVAQIERSVLEELAPRLEDAVHQAVRAAVDRAFGAQDKNSK